MKTQQLQKYKVTMRMITNFEICIEAYTAQEAKEFAENVDLERWSEDIDYTSYKVARLKPGDTEPRRHASVTEDSDDSEN